MRKLPFLQSAYLQDLYTAPPVPPEPNVVPGVSLPQVV